MANELFNPSRLLAVLQDLAKDVETNYKEHLEQHDRIASGDLLRSISTEIEVKGTTYTVYLNLADYWKYVEEDTKPHWPPKDAIDKWIFIKPVIPRPDDKGHLPTPEQLSFLIRRKIAGLAPDGQGGYKPGGTIGTHDLRDAKAEVLDKYEQKLLDALERDTLEYIEKITP